MRAYAPRDVNGIPVSQVGSGQVNDPEQKKSHQVDVAAFGNDTTGQRVLLTLVEAKWAKTAGLGRLARLRRIRELLVRSGQPGAEAARLLLFRQRRTLPQFRAAAAKGDVQLTGLSDIYA
jgi:hypothetical protein